MTRPIHWRCDGCRGLNLGKDSTCARANLLPYLTADNIYIQAPDWCPSTGKPAGAGLAVNRTPAEDSATLTAAILRLGNELVATGCPTTLLEVADVAERIAQDSRSKPATTQAWMMLCTRMRGATVKRTA